MRNDMTGVEELKRIVTAVLVFAPALACAQSQVTLYGVADDGIAFTSNQNGSHNYQMSNGALGSSKWGFLIKEDLGGGYGVTSVLDNGFHINTPNLNNRPPLFLPPPD